MIKARIPVYGWHLADWWTSILRLLQISQVLDWLEAGLPRSFASGFPSVEDITFGGLTVGTTRFRTISRSFKRPCAVNGICTERRRKRLACPVGGRNDYQHFLKYRPTFKKLKVITIRANGNTGAAIGSSNFLTRLQERLRPLMASSAPTFPQSRSRSDQPHLWNRMMQLGMIQTTTENRALMLRMIFPNSFIAWERLWFQSVRTVWISESAELFESSLFTLAMSHRGDTTIRQYLEGWYLVPHHSFIIISSVEIPTCWSHSCFPRPLISKTEASNDADYIIRSSWPKLSTRTSWRITMFTRSWEACRKHSQILISSVHFT